MRVDLSRLFYPRSFAVIGASTKRSWDWTSGNQWIAGAIRQGFPGSIFPVHPSADSILGFKAYKSILDIPGEVDLAIFTIPIKAVVQAMEECAQKGVKFVHLFTAGFAETGRKEYQDVEDALVEIARKAGIRLVGPNCMGIYCPEGGLSWSDELPKGAGTFASTGLFSQSGQMAFRMIHRGARHRLSFNKAVSYGNACDLQAHDFLDYMCEDDSVKTIGAYIEGLKDGRAFLEAVRRTTPNKPLVVWKGGQTEGGSRATLSHTSAMAGSLRIWESFCRQTGIISVDSMDEMIFTLKALESMALPADNRVAILGGAGGGSVTMTDMAEKEGLSVPYLSDETIRRIEELIPLEGHSAKNPLDIIPVLMSEESLMRLMDLLRDESNVDALVFELPVFWIYRDFGPTALYGYLDIAARAAKLLQKPTLFVVSAEADPNMEVIRKDAMRWLSENGQPAFPDFRLAARVMSYMKRYRDYLDR